MGSFRWATFLVRVFPGSEPAVPASQLTIRSGPGTRSDLPTEPGATLSFTVNGEACTAQAGSTVQKLLVSLGLEHRRVAVAINRDVVPRSTFTDQELAAGDRIEILEAVGGG